MQSFVMNLQFRGSWCYFCWQLPRLHCLRILQIWVPPCCGIPCWFLLLLHVQLSFPVTTSGFLRFYEGADFLSAVALAELADLARVRQLWILSRAYPRSIGDVMKLSALVRLLAFKDEAHARAFLVFHGLVVEDGLDPAG